MATETLIQTSVSPEIERRAAEVLGEMGMTVAEAVRLLLTRTAEEGALPFSTASDTEAHDRWFRAMVQEALDDPGPDIPHEEIKADVAGRKAALNPATNAAR